MKMDVNEMIMGHLQTLMSDNNTKRFALFAPKRLIMQEDSRHWYDHKCERISEKDPFKLEHFFLALEDMKKNDPDVLKDIIEEMRRRELI